MSRIYLDNAATTPLCDAARLAMLPWLSREGNPSSLHQEGRRAKDAIDASREIVSAQLGCLFAEVTFTSGGTESANMAILGAALKNRDARRNRILLGAAEHHCVLHTVPLLERIGYRCELIPVDSVARVQPESLGNLMDDDVLLVSVMHANNEIGTFQPVPELVQLTHRFGSLFHCDAVQTFASVPWRISDLDADLVTVCAHKINGPAGVGALYIRAGVPIQPINVGGGQERELRAGTENVAAIAGFGAAVQWRSSKGTTSEARDEFVQTLGSEWIPTAQPELTLKGHAHGRFPGIEAETLLIRLDRLGIAASSGAACSSGSIEPSHVLLAAGYSDLEAKQGLRFTFGIDSSVEDARRAGQIVLEAVQGIRAAR